MKHRRCVHSALTLIMASTLAVSFSACKSRQKREAERIEQQTKKQNELSDQREAVRAAEQEVVLTKRKNFFQAIEGRYSGSFSKSIGTQSIVVVELFAKYGTQVAGADPKREGSIQTAAEGITFDAVINESFVNSDGEIQQVVRCSQSALKPNLDNGTLSVSCMAQGSFANSRTYTLYLDDSSYGNDIHNETLLKRSQEQASRLLSVSRGNFDRMGVEIFTPPKTTFLVRLTRK